MDEHYENGYLSTPVETKVFWIIGFVLSTAALVFQALIYILLPCSRKLSVKLLTQMSVARLLNVAFEYTVTNGRLDNSPLNDAMYALYFQTDAALICWMFVFTKNLYEDIIVVFTEKSNFTIVTIVIWLVTLPVGLVGTLMLELDSRLNFIPKFTHFYIFYFCYAIVKFIILSVNLILFGIIFKVALARGKILRTCLVSFGLVSISSVQVFVTDSLTLATDKYPMVSIVSGVINSYQILMITAIFVILVQNFSEESLTKVLSRKFIRETV